jgi:hypothetical protein
VTFDYNYSGDVPNTFPASYRVNGVTTQFSDNAGASTQTGTVTFAITEGQTFGFLLQAASSDGSGGTLVISNFRLISDANLSGQFDPANWTIGTQSFGCGSSSVDTSAAPASVTLATGTGCASIGASFDYPVAPTTGTVTFTYNYSGNVPSTFPASYRVDGVTTQFSDNAGASTQSGTVTFAITQGQTFGFLFQASSSDGSGGTLTISNFRLISELIFDSGFEP